MHRRRWPDLPPELLHLISGLLHDATDFVRFHAVCRPWRISHEPTPTRKETTQQFLPWLLAPNEEVDDSLNFRCVFSKASFLAPPPPLSGTGGRNWVASTDGTAVCYFTADAPRGPALHHPLTGAPLARLRHFPDGRWEEENPSGTIYDDGTVLLYSKHDINDGDETEFRAALLRPGDDDWTVVERTLESSYYGEFCVAYHAGKIHVTVQNSLWHVMTTTRQSTASDDVLVVAPSSMRHDSEYYFYEYSHVLESHGELLWASMHVIVDYPENYKKGVRSLLRALSVHVHALDKAPNLQWVLKKGASLADKVLFLGWPNSFAVDASRLGVTGGCAYFVYDNNRGIWPPDKRRGVFKYNLIDNTTEFVDWLPIGWDDEMCTWLIPQPVIAPIHRTPATTAPMSNSMLHYTERRYGPCFRVLVRNLPMRANTTQLRQLFGKHGRVSDAEILYYKKTKRSQGIGILTMSTVHDHRGDALAALKGLFIGGCRLEVVLVKKGRRRRRRST